MIEKTIKDYLDGHLSVPPFLMSEDVMPDKYVIFEKTSSSKQDYATSAAFAFQSYAPTLYEAAELNEELKDAVETMVELDEIAGVHFNSDYNYTDTETKRYRYQAVFDINYF